MERKNRRTEERMTNVNVQRREGGGEGKGERERREGERREGEREGGRGAGQCVGEGN